MEKQSDSKSSPMFIVLMLATMQRHLTNLLVAGNSHDVLDSHGRRLQQSTEVKKPVEAVRDQRKQNF